MRTIAAAKFKQRCLTLLDTVGPEGLVITKHGRPVARLVPFYPGNGDLIGCLEGKIEVHGDLTSTGEVWDAAPADSGSEAAQVRSRAARSRQGKRAGRTGRQAR